MRIFCEECDKFVDVDEIVFHKAINSNTIFYGDILCPQDHIIATLESDRVGPKIIKLEDV